jgi:hypothetical protein
MDFKHWSRVTKVVPGVAIVCMSVVVAPAFGASASGNTGAAFTGSVDASGTAWQRFTVDVPAGTTVALSLSWSSAADLNLGLADPTGKWVSWATSRTSNPESLSYDAAAGGTYGIGVSARTGSAAFAVQVTETPIVAPSPQPTTTPSPGTVVHEGWLDDQESTTHTYTQAQAVSQAERFNVISAIGKTYTPYISAMKAANPQLHLAAYMNGTMASGTEAQSAPESWFLHDAHGNRISNAWHLWLMDPANTGWVSNRVAKCKSLVAASGYDGCFLDNLGSGTIFPGMVSATPVNPRTGAPYTTGDWLSAATALASAVRSGTGDYTFSNGLVSGQAFYAGVAPASVLLKGSDMALAETFIRTANMGITQYRSEQAWKQDVDMVAATVAQGKRIAVITKVWCTGTQAQKDTWHDFALASFLLGTDGNQSFEFSYGSGTDISAGDARLATLGPLGQPAGPYIDNGGIYQRPFGGGLVLVNPTTSALTETLPTSSYVDSASGTAVGSTITLPAHTARILFS